MHFTVLICWRKTWYFLNIVDLILVTKHVCSSLLLTKHKFRIFFEMKKENFKPNILQNPLLLIISLRYCSCSAYVNCKTSVFISVLRIVRVPKDCIFYYLMPLVLIVNAFVAYHHDAASYGRAGRHKDIRTHMMTTPKNANKLLSPEMDSISRYQFKTFRWWSSGL
jgi:hypothetical protein